MSDKEATDKNTADIGADKPAPSNDSSKPKPDAPCCDKRPSSSVKNAKALLLAMKPYLDKERCEKIDRILCALKLAELASGLRLFT